MGKSWLLQNVRSRLGGVAGLVGGPPFPAGLLRAFGHLLSAERDPAFLTSARHFLPGGPWPAAVTEVAEPGSREELHLAVAHGLARCAWQQAGLCLLLEDLHDWSRDDLDALRVVWSRALAVRAPLLLLASSRPQEETDWWSRIFGDLPSGARHRCQLIELSTLDRAETSALVEGVLRTKRLPESLTDWLYDHSGGHPLHAVELLRFLLEGDALVNLGPAWRFSPPRGWLLPRGLEAVLDARLEQARADREMWTGLAGLAVVERPMELAEWARLTGLPSEPLAELGGEAARLGLVRLELGRGQELYSLAHPLYPQRLRSLLSRSERRELHRRAAEGAPETGERAKHARLGGHEKAVEWTRMALSDARAKLAHSQAEAHCQALLALGASDSDDLHHQLGEAQFYQGQLERARESLARSGRPESRLLEAQTLIRLGRNGEALELLQSAIPTVDEQLRTRLRALEAPLLFALGRLEEGGARLEVLLEEAAPGSLERGHALLERGRLLYMERQFGEALRITEEAVGIFRNGHDMIQLARALNNIGIYASHLGLWERSEQALQEAISLTDAQGDKTNLALRQLNLGSLQNRRGYYDQAEESFEKALRLAEANGDVEVSRTAILNLAEVQFYRGNHQQSAAFYRQAVRECEAAGKRVEAAIYRTGLAQAEAHLGRIEVALALLDSADVDSPHPYLPLCRADILLLAGFPDRAEAELEGQGPVVSRATTLAEYQLARSLVQAIRGNDASAGELLASAFELLEEAEHRPLMGQALMQQAMLHHRRGQQAEAQRLAGESVACLEPGEGWGHLSTLERLFPIVRQLRTGKPGESGGPESEPLQPQPAPLLRVLGRFELESPQHGGWRARKTRDLLALLLVVSLREDGPWVSRERIIADLWPDSSATRAAASFRSTIRRLREALEGAGLVERNAHGEYSVRLLRCDVFLFLESLVTDPEAALAWYGGELLPGVDVPGVETVRERLRSRFRDSAHRLAASVSPGRAIALYQRLLDDDPFDVDALRGLVLNLERQADHGRARRTLEGMAARYREELGEVPAELAELVFRDIS